MAHLSYRCPQTGEKVQIWIVEDEADAISPKPYMRVQCPICGHTHVVNIASGVAARSEFAQWRAVER